MKQEKKYIFWDWNGTLFDDAEVILGCINGSLGAFACAPLSMDAFREVQVDKLSDFYSAVGVPKDKIDSALKTEREIFHSAYEPKADAASLRQGATDVLGQLAEGRVSNIILSNHIADQIVRRLKRHDIHHYFEDVLAYLNHATQFRDLTKGERLRRYMEEKKLSPAQALIIGDTKEEVDIARDHGLCSVAITGGLASETRLLSARPDHLIHSLDALPPILKERGFLA